jgi:hypothetical protein
MDKAPYFTIKKQTEELKKQKLMETLRKD